jgi:hypothetical protein
MRKFLKAAMAVFFFTAFAMHAFAEGEDIAAKHRVTLWNFESGTAEGWHGNAKFAKSCSVSKEHASEGKYSLKVDLTGSKDWNQDIMVNDGPFDPSINKLVELSFDVFVPDATVKGLDYQEMYIVFSSKSNAWYQLKSPLNAGENKIVFKIDNSKIKQDMWHIYIITNNSQPFNGPIYIDNMVGRIAGEPGTVEGKITDKDTGAGIKDARVVVGDSLVVTDDSGNFKMTVPEDAYKMVVVAFGYKDQSSDVVVYAGKDKNLGNVAIVKKKEPIKKEVTINIDPAKIIRTIDKHKLLGQNIAAWHKPDGYRDAVALGKIEKMGATFFRIPGGDYANLYDWKTGDVYKFDGAVNWTPELNYLGGMVPFVKRMDVLDGNQTEVLPTLNIMTPAKKSINERINYGILWLQDLKDKGIKYRYVEIGNELDNKPDSPGPARAKEGKSMLDSPTDMKNIHWWTKIDNYCAVFNQAAYKVKVFDKTLKLMGPVPMQPMNQERLEGSPWMAASSKAPFWVEEFLKKSGQYMDTLAVHEYPFWANNDARLLLTKPQTTWPVYMPKFREWIKKYVNSKQPNKYVEIALTEWNSGDENVITALIENGLFCADYLGSFMKSGGDLAFCWDLFTQKPGLGGGHGAMDEENDPTNKYSERSHYWVFSMYNNYFGTKMVECSSSSADLSVYAAMVDDSTISIMAINKTKLSISSAKINVKGKTVSGSAKAWQLSDREYVWSKELYRPIVNSGPSELNVNLENGVYDFPPYSVTVLQVKI